VLGHLAAYFEHPYQLCALTLDPCFGGEHTDYAPLTAFLQQVGVRHTVVRTNIGHLVFDVRQERNPCALCAKMRRGALHTEAKKLGCNKVALGHHLDDAVETFYMNLFGEGRLGCFSPVTWMSRKEVTVIRPLVLATEREVARAAAESGAPIIKNPCPVDGCTARAKIKDFVAARSGLDRAFRQKTLGALQKSGLDGWAPPAPNAPPPPTEEACDGF
ncbi:MAG: ATP-binding protein, partial [Oscillospiraceae bacterium]